MCIHYYDLISPLFSRSFLPRAAVRRLSTVVDGKSPEVLHPFAYSQARDVSGNANSSGAFDWRQSVLLAAASFEAYFGLAREINAPDVTRSGARITYVDR